MEDIDGLEDRALDAAVARYLFGLEVEDRIIARTHEKDVVCRQPGKDWNRCDNYASSVRASLNVENELAKHGWTLRRPVRAGVGWKPEDGRVLLEHTDGRIVEAEGASVNEALCRAALRAVAS